MSVSADGRLQTAGLRYGCLLFAVCCLLGFSAQALANDPVCSEGQLVHDGPLSGCERVGIKGKEKGKRIRYGQWTVRGFTGKVSQEVTYDHHGVQDGPARIYYPDGKLKEVLHFAGGKPTGVWSYWFDNGHKKEERGYRDGELHGLRKRWNEKREPGGMECFIWGERRAVSDCTVAALEKDRPSRAIASKRGGRSKK